MENPEIVVIGGSAGSISVLMQIIPFIPEKFAFPILIVVHRKPDGKSILEKILHEKSKIKIVKIKENMSIIKDAVFIAPAGFHLLIDKNHNFKLDSSEKVNYAKPSIDVTFESVVDVYKNKVVGILLSGSNGDGAMGMKKIKDANGTTIIQSADTSFMKTMPKSAEKITEIDYILSPKQILSKLISLNNN